MPGVVATDPLHRAGEELLEAAGIELRVPAGRSYEELEQLVASADALIVRSKIPASMLDAGKRLRAVVRHGAGLDFIPMERASALHIPVAYVPGANAQSVAEYVFAAIFNLTRRLALADATVRTESWAAARERANHATELRGRTLGIVGVGNVGQKVAEIGYRGFGMNVLGYQRRLDALPAFVAPCRLPDLVAQSDFIVLSCPLTDETRNMMDAALLGRAKKTAYLVNVARGQLIDNAALVSALDAGSIAGAALDVFSEQPLPPEHPYRSLPNVLLTPHFAGLTTDSMRLLSRGACEETLRILRGERPLHLANPEIWDNRRR